ncbi:MAG TPA: 4'-phosphopantetheinyl transferase superfamily protein [Polyangiaceae bacterium]|jgi:enterobactin synthetase component D
MPRPLPNPALFPPFVAQHTLAFEATPGDPQALFPDEELPASLASAVPKRRLEFLAGRYCARQALRRCSVNQAADPIAVGPHREPVWPAGIVGTITHAHGYASAAVARATDLKSLGLDAESWMDAERAVELSAMIAAEPEIAVVQGGLGLSFARALTLIFSAKEAIFKCLFPEVGRYFDFRDAAVISANEPGAFSAELLVPLAPSLPAGWRLDGRFEFDEQGVRTGTMVLPADSPGT